MIRPAHGTLRKRMGAVNEQAWDVTKSMVPSNVGLDRRDAPLVLPA